MADLQDAVFPLGELDEFRRLRGVVGHRFFHEHVFALREQGFGQFKMGDGRGDDVERVGIGSGFGGGFKDACLVPGGDSSGGIGVGVKNAGEFDVTGGGQFGIDADVFLAERTGAQNSDLDL